MPTMSMRAPAAVCSVRKLGELVKEREVVGEQRCGCSAAAP